MLGDDCEWAPTCWSPTKRCGMVTAARNARLQPRSTQQSGSTHAAPGGLFVQADTRAATTAACERFVLLHSIPNSPTASVSGPRPPRPFVCAAYCSACMSDCGVASQVATGEQNQLPSGFEGYGERDPGTFLTARRTSRSCGEATFSGIAATAACTICSAASCVETWCLA